MVSVRSNRWLIALICSLLAMRTSAQTANVQSIQDAFEQKQTRTRTYQSNIRQTVRLKDMRDPIVSSGRLFFVSPDHLLIKFDRPHDEYIMIRGHDIFTKKQGEKPVHRRISSDDEKPGVTMLVELFRNGAAGVRDLYHAKAQKDAGAVSVTLTRKDSDGGDESVPKKIENHLLMPSLEIQSIRVSFDEEQSIFYEFLNPVRDRAIKADVFENPDAGQ